MRDELRKIQICIKKKLFYFIDRCLLQLYRLEVIGIYGYMESTIQGGSNFWFTFLSWISSKSILKKDYSFHQINGTLRKYFETATLPSNVSPWWMDCLLYLYLPPFSTLRSLLYIQNMRFSHVPIISLRRLHPIGPRTRRGGDGWGWKGKVLCGICMQCKDSAKLRRQGRVGGR